MENELENFVLCHKDYIAKYIAKWMQRSVELLQHANYDIATINKTKKKLAADTLKAIREVIANK